MKYTLIHRITNERIECTKVEIDGYDYYINDDEINLLDYYYDMVYKHIARCGSISDKEWFNYKTTRYKKIIATNDPKIEVPQVIELIDIKMKMYINDRVPNGIEKDIALYENGFIDGYKINPYTRDDMINFIEFVNDKGYTKMDNFNWKSIYDREGKTIDELFDSWKKTKGIYYE